MCVVSSLYSHWRFPKCRHLHSPSIVYFFQYSPALLKFKSWQSYYSLYVTHSLSSNSSSPKLTNFSALLQGRIQYSHLLQIHAQIFRAGTHQDNLIATRLIGQYPPQLALLVFRQLRVPNLFPFNAIIRVMAEEGAFSHAIFFFKTLKQQSLSPNEFTFSFLLKACSQSSNAQFVKQIHTHIIKIAFVLDSFVCNGLLNSYTKGQKDFVSAHKIFDEMPGKGMVNSWTSLIAGCAQSGHSEEALQLFFRMVQENLKPENDTMVSVLSACSNFGSQEIGKWVRILSSLSGDVKSKNTAIDSINTVLVYLYGKWGKIQKSRESFDEISDNGRISVLPWNAIIGAYVQNGCPVEALSIFHSMLDTPNCRPNHVTMVSVLSACAEIGDLNLGNWIFKYMKSKGPKGIVESNTFLATALIDMYSKCGSLGRARHIFNQVASKDVVSFNAMIMGFAVNGEGREALSLFWRMEEFGLHPNAATFLGVLCACSHSGLFEEGRLIFLDMNPRFSVSPKLEHYACYIDLLSRVGLIEEAFEVVSSMPFEPNNFLWGALLGGCLLHSRAELALDVSKRLVEVDPENSAAYVMLSNAYAADGRWHDVSRLRFSMREKGVSKQPGHSWISIDGVVHEFAVGFPAHPRIESIYHILNGLGKQMTVASL